MGKMTTWIATACVTIACMAVAVLAFPPTAPTAPGGATPFAGIADQIAASSETVAPEDGDTADKASGTAGETDGTAQNGESPAIGDATGVYEEGAVLVSLDEGLTADEAASVIKQKTNLQDISVETVAGPVVKVSFGGNVSVEDAVKAIADTDAVTTAQPNYIYYPDASATDAASQAGTLTTPDGLSLIAPQASPINDPKATTWMLENINAYKAWDIVDKADKKKQVTVAVIDQGINLSHEDFTGKFVYDASTGKYTKPLFVAPYNARTNKTGAANIKTKESHGSHVAGIIAAHVNNGKGVAGVTNNMVQIMPVQVFDETGTKTNTANIVRGLNYVVKNAKKYNVRVINMSVGGGCKNSNWRYSDRLMMDAMADAYDAEIVPVVSAGNQSDDPEESKLPFYHSPGDLNQAVSVINLRNTDPSDPSMVNRYHTSNYNTADQMAKDISAPGTAIMSAGAGNANRYVEYTGTSMAAPVVAGVMALMFVADNSLTAEQAVSKLCSAAATIYSRQLGIGDPIWSSEFGYGAVNAKLAVDDSEFLSGPVTLFVGERQTFKLNLPASAQAEPDKLNWRIYKTVGGEVATLKANGLKATITGKKEGAFVVIAEAKVKGKTYRAQQTVAVYKPNVVGSTNLAIGEKETYFTSSQPAGGGRKWVWTSSNPKVASVSKAGVVTAKGTGTTTLTATLKSNPKIKDTKKVKVNRIDLGNDDLTLSYRIPTYTGKALKPKFTLKMNEVTLTEGKDFKVTFLKNVAAGQTAGKLKLTALKGSKLCTGAGTASFTIKSAPIAKAKVTNLGNRKYTGKAVAPQKPKVVLGKTTLKEGSDYTVSYLNAGKKAIKAANVKAKGAYYVVITGKGNYAGKITKSFSVS